MAVYTDVADDELRAFIALYDIGEVLACKGIAEGVENSNFLVTTECGNFILTLYEKRVAAEDLPFFIALMEHLAAQNVACPTPIKGRDGAALRELCGRPAALVTFLAVRVAQGAIETTAVTAEAAAADAAPPPPR